MGETHFTRIEKGIKTLFITFLVEFCLFLIYKFASVNIPIEKSHNFISINFGNKVGGVILFVLMNFLLLRHALKHVTLRRNSLFVLGIEMVHFLFYMIYFPSNFRVTEELMRFGSVYDVGKLSFILLFLMLFKNIRDYGIKNNPLSAR